MKGLKHCASNNCIYFFGGYDGNKYSNDFYELKVD